MLAHDPLSSASERSKSELGPALHKTLAELLAKEKIIKLLMSNAVPGPGLPLSDDELNASCAGISESAKSQSKGPLLSIFACLPCYNCFWLGP